MIASIFIDANIPIYAAGRPHPLKEPCAAFLAIAAERPARVVTDAEVLQELLHRYRGARSGAGLLLLDAFATVMRGRVFSVRADDVMSARALADVVEARLSARDLLHLAVMRRLGCGLVVTADRVFDEVAGIRRLDPSQWPSWRDALGDRPTRTGRPGTAEPVPWARSALLLMRAARGVVARRSSGYTPMRPAVQASRRLRIVRSSARHC